MLALAVASITSGLLVLYAAYWIKNTRFRNAINKFPGPATLPLIGNAHQMGRESTEFYRNCVKYSKQYKEGVFRIWLGPFPFLTLYKAELLDCVMSTINAKKSLHYDLIKPWLRDGLLLSHGGKWQKRRKMLTPTFHYSILEDFMSVFHQQSAKLVRILKEKTGGEEFDIYPYVTRCALDVICQSAMGIDLNSQEEETEYVNAVYKESSLIMGRAAQPWLFNENLFRLTSSGRTQAEYLRVLHGFTGKVIADRWKEYETKMERGEKFEGEQFDVYGKKRRFAFLDLLIQNSLTDKSMTLDDIQEEVDTFMFEGHDTTASAIAWAIYNVGRHPEWQEKIRQELLQHAVAGEPLSMQDLSEMKVLESFLKESIRLFTTVPLISREVTEDCMIGSYWCPKGAQIQILMGEVHRDPKYFPDPEKFDPERWMSEDITKRHPFCYVPFSSGLRNCIGQKFAMLEWKTTVAEIVRHFNVRCDHNLDDLKEQSAELILRPNHGLPVKLTKI